MYELSRQTLYSNHTYMSVQMHFVAIKLIVILFFLLIVALNKDSYEIFPILSLASKLPFSRDNSTF